MPKKEQILVSVVVPAYNEEDLLPKFIQEVTGCLRKAAVSHELLIVENGSKDKTLEIARKFAKKNPSIKVEHLPNPSYGKALIYGIRHSKGKYVIVYNVDFWDSKFIDLVKVDLLGYDMVVGSKNLPGSEDKRPLGRRFVTKGFNFFLKVLFGYKGTDTHGIKVYRSLKISSVLRRCKTKTGIFDTEIIIRSQRMGLKILELPVVVEEKRPSRFSSRLFKTVGDIGRLYYVLQGNQ